MPMCANGLAKLVEECGELQAELPCLIVGDDDGRASNRVEAEMGDVFAAFALVRGLFGLDASRIARHEAEARTATRVLAMSTPRAVARLQRALGLLAAVAGKKLAYFHTDEHPDGGGSLRDRMETAIAYCQIACLSVMEFADLDEVSINERADEKLTRFRAWHAVADNNVHGVDAPAPAAAEAV